ncbi:GntR family transcriptional regulator [Mariniphaga sp.]|uniref:GntR family transcriptional regulator n=1 Tax=Mariniphaga sp. TaxID=1954475 RepID=UPI00356A8BFA
MIQHSDLSIPVYNKLKEMIIDNELKPGEKLLQEKLAARLGVSRTPLLKAMQMLEYDFLVESIPRRGMFVKKLSTNEMRDIYDVREGIETVAVRLVAERRDEKQLRQLKNIWKPFENASSIEVEKYRKADDRFHALLLEFSGNKMLQKIYSHSLVQLRVEQMGLMRPPEETISEHLAILNAIEKGDTELAALELRNHLLKSKALIQENFKN